MLNFNITVASIETATDLEQAPRAVNRYNISACARLMKVSRVTIYRLCRKHQLELETLR